METDLQKSTQAQPEAPSVLHSPHDNTPRNLLLFTGTEDRQSYSQWQESVKNVTPDGKDTTWREDFEAFLKTYKRKEADMEFVGKRNISLPDSFCTQCGNHDVPRGEAEGRNITEFHETYPAADILVGDIATGIVCKSCVEYLEADIEGDDKLQCELELPKEFFYEKRKKRAKQSEEHIVNYITVQRSAGVTGTVLGDEVRRRDYRDVD